MAIGSPIKYPRLTIVVVSAIPLLSSYITAVLVRWVADRRELTIYLSKSTSSIVILSIYTIMAVFGGVLLELANGIPPGIGVSWTVAFLIGVYIGPAVLGILLFDRFLSSKTGVDDVDENSDSSLSEATGQDIVLNFRIRTNILFVVGNVVTLPSFFVFGIIVAS